MKIKVWGSRGSISTPGATTFRYGGNTTCLEIRSSQGHVIVIDAGTGVRLLGKALIEDASVSSIRLLLTHSHWDHLTGFPFFEPAYSPKYSITLCGGKHSQDSIRKYLEHQMEPPYFPVDFSVLKARFDYTCNCPKSGQNCCLGKFQFCPIPLSHPNGGYGFKFMDRGKSFVFLPDNELGFDHQNAPSRREQIEFCRGVDLLFHDAQYTDEEYKLTRGWGHSTFAAAVDFAVEAGVKSLGLFHHDPDRTDDDLDGQVDFCRKRIAHGGAKIDCFAVAESSVFDLAGS